MSLFQRLLGRRNRWAESWQTFPGAVGDAPALWAVDLGAVDAAPVAALPVRVDVRVPYPAGPDGLPTGHLAELEETVRAAVDALGGAYVGRVASQGQACFTAQLPSEPPTLDQFVHLPGASVQAEYDPHWAYVRDTLAPDVRQHRLLADRAMLDLLSEQGDHLGTPREVIHTAYFAAEDGAGRAATELAGEGFATTVEPDDEGEFSLTAVRRYAVAPPAVHELTWRVQDIVERHDGTYEGWHCAVAA